MKDTDKKKQLFDLFQQLPPDYEKINKLLSAGKYSHDDMAEAYIDFLEENIWEYGDRLTIAEECAKYDAPDEHTEPDFTDMHSEHMLPLAKLLIEHGMNLNLVYNGTCILRALIFIDTPYVAADIAALCLENGADPDIVIDWENFIESVDHAVSYVKFYSLDEHYDEIIDSRMHLYMVGLGYGCKTQDGHLLSEPVKYFSFDAFKNYRKYGYEDCYHNGRSCIRFFEKESHTIVAYY